jgi:catechol 2,3-dioxygenase-like lactoylglutathione lyase family enzyme
MLTTFDHVTIAVHDIDAATGRYRQLLGAEPIWRGGDPELGTRTVLFGLCNGSVELVSPSGQAPENEGLRALLTARGEGVQAIALGTDDAAEVSALLRARGLAATRPQEGSSRDDAGAIRSFRTVELSTRNTRGLSVFAVQRPDLLALRSASPPPAACVEALDHIVIRTSAPDAAIALYERGLGIRLALDRQFGPRRMLFFRIGGVTLEVVHDPALGDSDSFYGVAYRVRDLAAAHARLRAAGFAVNEPRAGNKPGTRVFSVRDGTSGVPTLMLRDPARDRGVHDGPT